MCARPTQRVMTGWLRGCGPKRGIAGRGVVAEARRETRDHWAVLPPEEDRPADGRVVGVGPWPGTHDSRSSSRR